MTVADASRSGWSLVFHGPFSRLFWAGFISSMGDWAALFAQITLADSIAGPKGIIVVLAARLLPGLLGGAMGGILADRAHRKAAIAAADFGRGLLVVSLAFVKALPVLFIVSFALELLTLLGQPARAATVPNLVHKDNLISANSLTLGAAYGTFPFGAGLAWIVGLFPAVTFFGLFPDPSEGTRALLFGVDALTFIISGLLVLTIPIPSQRISPERRRASRFDLRAPLRDLGEGIRFVATHRTVRPVVLGMSTALLGGGMLIVLGQRFAADVLNADEVGFFALLTALGTGGGVGIVGVSLYGERLLRRDVGFAGSLIVTGIALAAASLVKTVPGAMAWLTVMGFGAGAAYVMGFTHLHETVEDEMRGRTFAALFSLMRVGFLVSMTLAVPAEAFLEGRLGSPFDNATRDVLLLGGTIVLVSGLGTLWSLRRVFRRPKVSAEVLRSMDEAGRAFTGFRSSQPGSVEKNDATYPGADAEPSEEP